MPRSVRKCIYDKLVRDKLPQRMRQEGEIIDLRILRGEEYRKALTKKLGEEVSVLALSTDLGMQELAVIQEIMDCIAKSRGISRAEIVGAQYSKRCLRII